MFGGGEGKPRERRKIWSKTLVLDSWQEREGEQNSGKYSDEENILSLKEERQNGK